MVQLNNMKPTNSRKKNNKGFLRDVRNAIPRHCSNCGHKYEEENLTIIRKEDFNAVLHLTCNNCGESYLINVVSPTGMLQGSSRMPLKIDIASAKEASKFVNRNGAP